MNVGDIVKIRLKSSPVTTKVGIIIRNPRKMYMAGEIAEVMIDGEIKYVKKEHIELIERGDTDESK